MLNVFKKRVLILLMLIGVFSYAQVGIGTDSPQGILDISSTSSGVILPRMSTAQKNAISSPVEGMHVYDTDLDCTSVYGAGEWKSLCSNSSTVVNGGGLFLGTAIIKNTTNSQIGATETFVLCMVDGKPNSYTYYTLPDINSVQEGHSIVITPWYTPVETMKLPPIHLGFGKFNQKALVNQFGRVVLQTANPNTRIMTVDHISSRYYFWTDVIDPGTPVILTKVRNMWVQIFII